MDQTLLEYKNLAKGFFIGFVAAQFVSGWISGPFILCVLCFYVFSGPFVQQINTALTARLPAFEGLRSLFGILSLGKGTVGAADPQPEDFWRLPNTPVSSPFQNQ